MLYTWNCNLGVLKKSIVVISFILMVSVSNKAFSESWICTYEWEGEYLPWSVARAGDDVFSFSDLDIEYEIILETDNFVHLYNSFPLQDASYYSIVLNKETERFAMVYLDGAEDNSAIISGDCNITNNKENNRRKKNALKKIL